MATHFIFLPGMFQGHRKLWLQSMESQRVGYRAHPGPFQFHARISLNFRLRHGQLRVLISRLSCQYFSGPNSASGILWGRDMWSNTVSSMSNMQVFNHFLGNLIIYSRFHKENWLSLYWFFFFSFSFYSLFSFGCCCSVLSQVCLFSIPWTAAHWASRSLTMSLHKLIPIKSVIPSNHLILCRPILLLPSIFPSIRVFQWVSSSQQVAKVLEFQLQHQSFQWTLRTDII